MDGYLKNPELACEVAGKIPEGMKYAFYRDAPEPENDSSVLERLATFLQQQALLAKSRGMFDLEPLAITFGKTRVSNSHDKRKESKNTRQEKVCAAVQHENQDLSSKNDFTNCKFCHRNNHNITECREFGRVPSQRRWSLAKRLRLCFICLSERHRSPACDATSVCEHCGNRHHTLLHFFKKNSFRKETKKKSDNKNLGTLEQDVAREPQA